MGGLGAMSDHDYYTNVHTDIDPGQGEVFPNGIRRQEISVVMTDKSPARSGGERFSPSFAQVLRLDDSSQSSSRGHQPYYRRTITYLFRRHRL
jgi:hypothetical protein